MVSVTKAGFVHEFEIKISRSDFFADAKKVEKHCTIRNGWRELNAYEKTYVEQEGGLPDKHWLREHLTADNKYKTPFRPNYFWYVCPMGMIQLSELPDHAGLIELHDRGYLHQVKNAERLHKEKAPPLLYARLLSSFEARYWTLRLPK